MPSWPSFRALPKLPVEVFVWRQKRGYGSPSAAPEAQPGSAFSEMPPPSHSPAPELEEVGEGADKGNYCPQSAAGEAPIQQKGEQAPIRNLSHVTFPWLKALRELGTCLHTRALSHGNAPAPAQPVPQKLGYRFIQVIPIFQFLFSKSHAF